jgi:hypothetical protein
MRPPTSSPSVCPGSQTPRLEGHDGAQRSPVDLCLTHSLEHSPQNHASSLRFTGQRIDSVTSAFGRGTFPDQPPVGARLRDNRSGKGKRGQNCFSPSEEPGKQF